MMKQQRSILVSKCVVLVLNAVFAACGQTPREVAPWQEETAKGYLPYHHLTVGDFPINGEIHPEQGMYTRGFFHYRYKAHWITQTGHAIDRVTEWLVWSGFDRNKSSLKPGFKFAEQLLPHEQGHLDINELYSKHLAETPLDKLPVGEGADPRAAREDLRRKLQDLADRTTQEEQKEQDLYDAETAHGQNASKQQEWTSAIRRRLEQAGIVLTHT